MVSEHIIPNRAIRELATIADANGGEVTIGVDCDSVLIEAALPILLGAAERAEFDQMYIAASHQAEAWTAEHG